ncbi:hypothetical protein JHK84_047731 [Glycine max]|nr:hypothetical protein JHK86_047707 [Glycine max]KAG5102762.1 hypothetical protein JHK84_047731 [Glycine max]
MDNHEHANHRDTAQARIKNKGIRQHKVNDQAQNIDSLQLDDRTLQNLVLLEIEQLLQANQRSLRDYPSMPYPEDENCPAYLDNSLILLELN